MGFFLPQMSQMDTDLYSLNTNNCIIREIRGIRVEINNPQNSDGTQTEENPLIRAVCGILIRWQRYKNDRNSGLNMFRPFSQKYILF